jgi:hypothetical protein
MASEHIYLKANWDKPLHAPRIACDSAMNRELATDLEWKDNPSCTEDISEPQGNFPNMEETGVCRGKRKL